MFEQRKIIKAAKIKAKQEALEKYNETLKMEEAKKKLLSSKTDFNLLEKLIQSVNDNPDLKINIHLLDGTQIDIRTTSPENKSDEEKQMDWIADSAFEVFK